VRSYRTTRRAVGLLAAAALGTGLLSACASDDDDGSKSDSGDGGSGKTTITMGLFGTFGFEEAGLYDEYEKLNPDITIKQDVIERNENYYPALLNHLTSNSGLADVQAIEVANIAEVVDTQADRFMDLGKVDGASQDAFLDWKWQQATADDGKTIGLGTDVGPMAVCYRKDHFEAAGLPTDREEVAELWAGDWEKFLDAGRDFKKNGPEGVAWVDSADAVYDGAIASSEGKYYDDAGEVIYKDSPDVEAAWGIASTAAEEKLTGNLEQFTKQWDQAMSNGDFATISCPAWMLGYIQEKGGTKAEGKWDVAKSPKPGNWGGSFLGVPESGPNKDEAAKLVAWLTAPEQQAKLFAERGNFPSAPPAYDMEAVKTATNPYFGDAPIGELFSASAEEIPVQTIGPKDQVIDDNIGNGLQLIEQGKQDPDGAWDEAVKAVDNALDQ